MKRTTYILIGVFFVNILLVTAVMVYARMSMVSYNELGATLDFSTNKDSIDLRDIHTLEFVTSGMEEGDFYYGKNASVLIIPVLPENREKIVYPDSEYLKLEKQDGVLRVMVDLTFAAKHIEEHSKRKRVVLKDLLLRIEIGAALKQVIAGNGFEVRLKNIQLDNLLLNTDIIRFDSCTVGSIVVDGDNTDFRSINLHADNLYLDLDKTHRWKLEKGKIGTLHLTGSKQSRTELSDSQYDRLRWKPKSEKAELRITLKKETEIVKQIN